MQIEAGGMTCADCAQTVTRAVEALPGVARALVDLSAGKVSVQGDTYPAAIRRAIDAAGYTVLAS